MRQCHVSCVAVKTVVVKGKAPVDPECSAKLKVAHVYYEGNDVYDVMLNQVCCHLNLRLCSCFD